MELAGCSKEKCTAASLDTMEQGTKFKGMRERTGELYDVICQLTTGRAKNIVKGVGSKDGFEAWQELHKEFNRQTLAKTLRIYREVVCPMQKNIEDLLTEITIWENKVRDLEKVEKQELPEMVKMAALTELCPEDIRDLIYQQADEAVGYKKVTEKVVG